MLNMAFLIRNSKIFILPKLARVIKLPKNDLGILLKHPCTCFSRRNIAVLSQDSNYYNINHPRSFSLFSHNYQKVKPKSNAIVESKEGPYAGLTVGQKVKEAGKDVTYIGVILVGVGVLGVIAYAVGRELFSSSSPSGIFGHGLKKCKQNTKIIDLFGEPIKGYGETTRRGRRRHVSHVEFLDQDGTKHMRMKFYIEGPHKKGTVTLEAKQNDRQKYDIRFIYVETDGYPSRVIVVEDNRQLVL